jgi:CHAD domain-containing protein
VPDLHEVRKAAKRLRYTAEVAGPVLGPEAAGLVEAMKAAQDVLGDRQDTVVTRELCRRFGIEAFAAGENAWTFGRLHALEEARAAQAERAFRDLAPVLRARLEQAGG